MPASPLISVLLPVYNGEKFVAEAIESILAQTFGDFELIVIDDGSTDSSLEILQRYQRQDTRMRLFTQENQGLIRTLNRGLELAEGSFLARLDADDIAVPTRLEKQVEIFQQVPELVILGSAYVLVDADGLEIRLEHLPLNDTEIRWQMLFYCSFAHPSVMLRMKTLQDHRLTYNIDATYGEDYELWSRVLDFGVGMNLKEPLIKRRIHSAQISELKRSQINARADEIARNNLDRLGINLSLEIVHQLRVWFYKIPAVLNEADYHLIYTMLEILKVFEKQPRIDHSKFSVIRGRWLSKLFLVPCASSLGNSWKWRMIRYLEPEDLFNLGAYFLFRTALYLRQQAGSGE